jgi:DNA-binding HxlR family transcriptional regulator
VFSPHQLLVTNPLGCKWSLRVISAVRDDVTRPSEIERYCEGISTKVLNERFHKLIAFGVLERIELGAKRQHVEYRLTARGAQLLRVLGEIDALQTRIETGA